MKSLMWLVTVILENSGIRCRTNTQRDIITVMSRFEHEGLSFLTITLPRFAQAFERSLEQSTIDRSGFGGFQFRQAIPVFLQGMLCQVFDRRSGSLLPDPDVESIACIRQVCLLCKKVEIPCTEKRTRDALNKYQEIENELKTCQATLSSDRNDLIDRFRSIARRLWFGLEWNDNITVAPPWSWPRHGPGQTAERLTGNQKYCQRRWHRRLDRDFPLCEMVFHDYLTAAEHGHSVDLIEPWDEQPVKVRFVPKTLKAPRVIAMEPVCMQYTQQAVQSYLVGCLEKAPLTKGHINFSDQEVNRRAALQSSVDRSFATIDLSDASDRVLLDLVVEMLGGCPNLLGAVLACRSYRAELPNGTVVPLRKFASMGSALCFPIESMVFFTIVMVAMHRASNGPLNSETLFRLSRNVFVYGDDIIVPRKLVRSVCDELEAFGLKVNHQKTFSEGNFRESCGMDAFMGVDVTPARMKCFLPQHGADYSTLPSSIALANHLYRKGFWLAARHVRDYIENLFGEIPHVLEDAPCFGWYSFLGSYSFARWDKYLQRPLTRGVVVRPRYRKDKIESWPAAMKCLLQMASEQKDSETSFHSEKLPVPLKSDTKHLERSVRPGSEDIKFRWTSPF